MPVRQVPAQRTSALPGPGREAQRRRTRRALVEATQGLLTDGGPTPTVDAIAAAAEMSRRTVYMHFPTLDQLLVDAALGALSEVSIGTALENADADASGDDVHARVEALIRALLHLAPRTLPLGRQIIRLTVDSPAATEPGEPDRPRRGIRRTEWIEAAIAPITDRITPEEHQRLVAGLSLIIGFEAMIVLRDVCALDPETEARTAVWAAHALIDATLGGAS